MECIKINKNRLNVIQDLLKSKNIEYLSYGVQENHEPLKAFFSHEYWGDIYNNNGFYKNDPLVQAAKCLNNSIIPWDMVPISNQVQNQIMLRRLSLCNITSGVTCSIKKNNTFEIIALGFSNKNRNNYDFIQNSVSNIINYIKEKTF